MIPIRVTPPVGPLVGLGELKAHLRVDYGDDDALITSLEKAAVAHLDGWRGILGRCIQQQVWSVQFDRPGRHRLPFPDVSGITASAGEVELCHDALGSLVTLTEASIVDMTVRAPEEVGLVAALAVKMLVAHWYHHPEAVSTSGKSEVPMAVSAILAPVRWVLV